MFLITLCLGIGLLLYAVLYYFYTCPCGTFFLLPESNLSLGVRFTYTSRGLASTFALAYGINFTYTSRGLGLTRDRLVVRGLKSTVISLALY